LKKRINLNISRPKRPCKEEICDTSQQERPFGLGRVKAEITGCDRTTAEGRTISEKISLCGLNHSHLNAIIGFTFVARRAGIQQANSDTPVSNNEIRMNVAGSVALTPKSKVFINRVSATAGALHLQQAIVSGAAPSQWALRVLTIGFAALTVALLLIVRRQSGWRRAVWVSALALFAVSASHLSHHEGSDYSWWVEVIGHHAVAFVRLLVAFTQP
jgi:hypothetical protein